MKRGVCRAVARRVHVRAATAARANRVIAALNSIFSGRRIGLDVSCVRCLEDLPQNQQEAIRGILRAVRQLDKPPMHVTGLEALKALRAASATYEDVGTGVGDVVSLDLGSLSLPDECGDGVSLQDAVEGSLRDVVLDFENTMLQDADIWTNISRNIEAIRPYDDPSLRSRPIFLDFIGELYKRGLLRLTTTGRGRVGAFAVSKKPKFINGVLQPRQRLVLDCRFVNNLFRPAPHTNLGSLTALAEMQIPAEKQLFLAGCDIRDCFYAVQVEDKLSDYFCLMQDVTGDELYRISNGLLGESGGSGFYSPAISVLPMGFSWSFFLVQAIHESSVCRALSLSRDSLILDGHPAPELREGALLAMPYCDNAHVISLDESSCNVGIDRAKSDLQDLGFSVHEDEAASSLFKTLGGVVDGCTGEVRTTAARMWNLIFAFDHIATHKVDPDTVQRLLGHAMVVCTINRCGMCVFRHLYDFVQKGGHARFLNKQEQGECYNFSGLLPMLVASMRRSWSDVVVITDASPDGYGICERQLDTQTVADIGRWQERWRYKRLPPEDWAPRRRALGVDVFGSFDSVLGVNPMEQQDWDWVEDKNFPEVPRTVLHPQFWKTKKMGKWGNTAEHITIKEGRALVIAVRRLTRASKNRGKRHLFLCDNLGLVLAVNKGRAHNVAILRITQQISSLCVAGGFTIRLRWVPSELNLADGPSRGQVCPGAYRKPASGELAEADCPSVEYASHQEPDEETESLFEQQFHRASSREEGDEAAIQGSAAEGCKANTAAEQEVAAAAPHPRGGWSRSTGSTKQTHTPRGAKHLVRGAAPVPGPFESLQEFLPCSRFRMAPVQMRRGACRLPGSRVFGRKVVNRRRETGGSHRVQFDQMERSSSEEQESFEGLEEREAPRIKAAAASTGVLRHGNGALGSEQKARGVEVVARPRHIPSSWRVHRLEGARHSDPSEGSRQAVPVLCRDRKKLSGWACRQGRGLRQHSSLEQSREAVHRSATSSTSEAAEIYGGPGVPVHLSQVQGCLHSERCSPGDSGTASIPNSAWRGCRRFERRRKRPRSGQSQRSVDDGHKRAKIHQNRKDPTDDEQIISRTSGVLSLVAAEHGQSYARFGIAKNALNDLGWPDITAVKTSESFGLEIFAGTARITTCMLRQGLLTFPIDICIDPTHDILDVHLQHNILHWILGGKVRFCWLGIPCTSFTRARKNDGLGPGPIRSDEYVAGLPFFICQRLEESPYGQCSAGCQFEAFGSLSRCQGAICPGKSCFEFYLEDATNVEVCPQILSHYCDSGLLSIWRTLEEAYFYSRLVLEHATSSKTMLLTQQIMFTYTTATHHPVRT